ncbi:unnamed protein product [Neisseria lactamica Y92-1009]|nr:unnamed protein product [Neisseria lactamica Y92-1009]
MTALPRFGIFCNPFAHSKTPQIHRQMAHQDGVDSEYESICAAIRGLPQSDWTFTETRGCGAHVNKLFKRESPAS